MKTQTITPFGKPMKVKKGALTRQAKAKGQSISQFCNSSDKKSATTKKRCGLAKAFKTMNARKTSK